MYLIPQYLLLLFVFQFLSGCQNNPLAPDLRDSEIKGAEMPLEFDFVSASGLDLGGELVIEKAEKANYYDLYYGFSSDNLDKVFPRITIESLSDNQGLIRLSGLTNGVTYHFRLQAVNNSGKTFSRSIVSLTPTASPSGQVPTKLSFQIQPSSSSTAGGNLATQPIVAILDAANNIITSSNSSVSLSYFTDSSCTTPLSATNLAGGTSAFGTSTLSAVNGIASFTNIGFNLATTVYIKATSSGLTPACSTSIAVNPHTPHSLLWSQQPPASSLAGSNLSTQPRVLVRDQFLNLTVNTISTISLKSYDSADCSGSETSVLGTSSLMTISALATFSNIRIDNASTKSLSAESGSLKICHNMTVSPGPGTQIIIEQDITKFANIVQRSTLAYGLTIMLTDDYGNPINGEEIGISGLTGLSCQSNALTTGSDGRVTFKNCLMDDDVRDGYTLAFVLTSNPSVTANTSSFNIINPPLISQSKLAKSESHTCAITQADQKLKCWGDNRSFQLTQNLSDPELSPVEVNAFSGNTLKSVSVTDIGTCIIDNNGKPYCFGENKAAELGESSPQIYPDPERMNHTTNIIKISSSFEHTCVIDDNYLLYCVGSNRRGQLGDGSYDPVRRIEVPILGGTVQFKDVVAGAAHTCAISTNDELWCFGSNDYGESDIDSSDVDIPTPVKNSFLGAIKGLAISGATNCAIDGTSDKIICWGDNASGQLGNGTNDPYRGPATVAASDIPSSIFGGFNSSTFCAQLPGELYCWGDNRWSQFGDGYDISSNIITLAQSEVYSSLVLTSSGGCGITQLGRLQCWGERYLGNGTSDSERSPVVIDGSVLYGESTSEAGEVLKNIKTLSLSHTNAICYINKSNKLTCTGTNFGQIFGEVNAGNTNYLVVQSTINYKKISLSKYNSTVGCGIDDNAELWCWGSNEFGQLGNSTPLTAGPHLPVRPFSGTSIRDVSVGAAHVCAITVTNDKLYCWGKNGDGQLGDGTTINRSTPTLIDPSNKYIKISVADTFSCGLDATQKIYCWGENNYGQLGIGNTSNQSSPTRINPISSDFYEDIEVGTRHACGILDNTRLACWGNGANGEFGDGANISYSSPTVVAADVASLSLGYLYSCYINLTNDLFCSGDGREGKLGLGDENQVSVFTQVNPGAKYNQISLSDSRTCAVRNENDSAECWGSNSSSGLGVGSSAPKILVPTPIQ